jgi:rubrerythrin
MMPTLTPTKITGGTTKLMPMVYAEPDQQMREEKLAEFLPGSGMNGAFLAEVMSGMLAHERCGRHLYRTCETRSNNPVLQAKYREFGAETERHVEILEQLIAEGGGSPMYVGPTARAVLGTDTKLVEAAFALGGSLDPVTAEMALLDAVFLAESMDHANWKLLGQLTEQLRDTRWYDSFRAAVTEVEEQEDRHLGWATDTKARLVLAQASSEGMAHLAGTLEETIARVKNWLAE